MSWKGYAQDLGGAQPIGSTSFVSDSVPGREDGLCGAPGSASNNPVPTPLHERLQWVSHRRSSYTAASLVAGTGTANNPQYSDQYVAKHFPFRWFASLTGGGAGQSDGHTAHRTPGLSRRWHQLRRQPHRQPGRPEPRSDPRPATTTQSRSSAGSPRTTAAMPTTPRARATTCREPSACTRAVPTPVRSTSTIRSTARPDCRPTTPRPPRPGTTPAGSTPRTCSWRTTSRSSSSPRPMPTAA